ncbi:MAG: ORF6N domain-containing protein [Pseudomonadota bacterium]|nr:ORF6N domain-containing protein [Pseudomonadota bacterium]
MSELVPTPFAERILIVRGQRVMLDADLAALYGVPTKRFNEQVKRNLARFPVEFMFQLTAAEKKEVVANCDHLARLKFSPHAPYAFTEHGAIMAATLLNSPKAVEMSVFVVRAFVELRDWLSSHREIAEKLDYLERKVSSHDQALAGVIDTLRQLTAPPQPKKRPIGFITDREENA